RAVIAALLGMEGADLAEALDEDPSALVNEDAHGVYCPAVLLFSDQCCSLAIQARRGNQFFLRTIFPYSLLERRTPTLERKIQLLLNQPEHLGKKYPVLTDSDVNCDWVKLLRFEQRAREKVTIPKPWFRSIHGNCVPNYESGPVLEGVDRHGAQQLDDPICPLGR